VDRLNGILSLLALVPPAVPDADPLPEEPSLTVEPDPTYRVHTHKCAVKTCHAKPTHQVLVVAHPGEETFTYANLQTCVRCIPRTAEEVFPGNGLDPFRATYPHTTHFSVRAYALS